MSTLRLGRYVVSDEIAAGGMATVHLGRLVGPVGFSRTVAIKRLHPQFAKDPEFVAMMLDEARLAARVRHPNVVTTFDVVASKGELFLVMEYVAGEPFSVLFRAATHARERMEPAVVSAIIANTLLGLHAAHEATDERGRPLHLVHRDVSPQNILVGSDGVARVVDFGVAKAASRTQTTMDGQIKGKLAYMAPEQLLRRPVDRRADIFAAGVVLWEGLTGVRLFASDDAAGAVARILECKVEPPSELADLPRAVDEVLALALSPRAADRYPTAREMALALSAAIPPASTLDVGEWVERLVGSALAKKAQRVAAMENSWPEAVPDDDGGDDAVKVLVEVRAPAAADAVTEVVTPPSPPSPSSPPPSPPAWRSAPRSTSLRAAGVVLLIGAAGVIGYRLRPDPAPAEPRREAPLAAAVDSAPAAPTSVGVATAEVDAAGEAPPAAEDPAPSTRRKRASSAAVRPPAPATTTARPALAPLKEYE